MRIEFEIVLTKDYKLDLLQLIPEKFRSSPILTEFVEEFSLLVGGWLQKTEDLNTIVDPYTTAETYLKHIASLVDVKLLDVDDRSLLETRREITSAVDWYKLKGSYQSLQIVAGIIGKTVDIADFYTDDYETFYPISEWFVGSEDENPPGLDSSYYKSPHFGFNVLLDTEYEALTSDGYSYLWSNTQNEDIYNYIERMRPAHTVPRRIIQLNLQINGTTLTSTSYLDSGQQGGGITQNAETGWVTWRLRDPTTTILYFDSRTDEGGTDLHFDDAVETWYFDQGVGVEQFDINTWKLGTGNKVFTIEERIVLAQASLNTVGWDLDTIVTSGTDIITDTTTYANGILYTIKVPAATVLSGVSELALYEGTAITYVALFPDIYKAAGLELWIQIFVITAD